MVPQNHACRHSFRFKTSMKPSTPMLFRVGNTRPSLPKLSNSRAHMKEPINTHNTPHHGRRNFLAAFISPLTSFARDIGGPPSLRSPILVRPALGGRPTLRRLLLLLLLLLLLHLELTQQLLRGLYLLGVRLRLWSFSGSVGGIVSRVIYRLFGDVHALHSLFIHRQPIVVLGRRHGRCTVGNSARL